MVTEQPAYIVKVKRPLCWVQAGAEDVNNISSVNKKIIMFLNTKNNVINKKRVGERDKGSDSLLVP